jgi:hypothetical protein
MFARERYEVHSFAPTQATFAEYFVVTRLFDSSMFCASSKITKL